MNNQVEAKDTAIGIRLTTEQHTAVQKIASKYCNTMTGVIRMAVQQLIEKENQVLEAFQNFQKSNLNRRNSQ